MIEAKEITFSYGRHCPNVLQDLSMQLEPGRIYGLLGKNGTGKSTLLYLIAGLLFPQKGTLTFEGRKTRLRSIETLQDIFLVPEEFELPDITLSQYVKLNAPFYPKFDHTLLAECLREFNLPEALHLGRLSMGQRKKAFLSFALATGTRLLLMDEPTNGLDIPSKSQFRSVVARSMSDERSIVISTHQVRDVDMLIDHILMLDGNALRLDASTADVCRNLCFEMRTPGEADGVIYAEPTLSGMACVCRNTQGKDTQLNLELLFNAIINRPDLAEMICPRENRNTPHLT